jgi:hypothetical protein
MLLRKEYQTNDEKVDKCKDEQGLLMSEESVAGTHLHPVHAGPRICRSINSCITYRLLSQSYCRKDATIWAKLRP